MLLAIKILFAASISSPSGVPVCSRAVTSHTIWKDGVQASGAAWKSAAGDAGVNQPCFGTACNGCDIDDSPAGRALGGTMLLAQFRPSASPLEVRPRTASVRSERLRIKSDRGSG